MAATVLGKRTRSSEDVADSPAVHTRSKRRLVLKDQDEENENPFITRRRSQSPAIEEDDEEEEVAPPTKRTRRILPLKRASPSKLNSHFKQAKPVIEIYSDRKSICATPTTPRHRDLQVKVPITPRHRILLGGGGTPRTPKTPSTPSNAHSVYHRARQLFSRCSAPGKLIGREDERREISDFIENSVEGSSSGCIYVSGPPGTGKSALIGEVSQDYVTSDQLNMSVVNCMSVRNAKDLSQKLIEDLGLKENGGFSYLRACFDGSEGAEGAKYLVVLDEVDCLVDLDLELLYSLFEWSMQPDSRLVLIGIANALDLTDRFLPRLKSRNIKPDLLPFMPYSAAQIADVITSKLKSLCPTESSLVPFLHPAAIQFCAKKVAAQTGDLRKAFDICKRAIEMVETETKEKDAAAALQESPTKTPLMDNINLSSPPTPRSQSKLLRTTAYTLETAPKATIAHMARVTALAFSNGTTQRLGTLNLQQKAVLCSLAALEKKKRDAQVEKTVFSTPSKTGNNTAPSIKQLFEAYCGLCKREKLLHPLTNSEFRDVVSGLETLGLISAVDGKNGSFNVPITPSRTPSRRGKSGFSSAAVGDDRRVASVVSFKELSGALDGPGGELLREILEGGALL